MLRVFDKITVSSNEYLCQGNAGRKMFGAATLLYTFSESFVTGYKYIKSSLDHDEGKRHRFTMVWYDILDLPDNDFYASKPSTLQLIIPDDPIFFYRISFAHPAWPFPYLLLLF